MVAFILLSGTGASAVRSGIMASTFLLAARLARPKQALNALFFSAVAMVFVNPSILAGNISFQLSFLATLGVVWVAPALERRLARLP
jgi:competence protein ComEC